MVEKYHFSIQKEKDYDDMITHFEPTNFQINTHEDYDVGGWIYIKFCPLCGKRLVSTDE